MSTVNRISENFSIYAYYEDDASAGVQLPADAQVATDNHNFVGWIDMQQYEKGLCLYTTIDGANAASTFRIISNTSSIGAGTDHAVKTLTTPGNVDAALESAFLEWSADEITAGDRYVTADLNQTGAQTCFVVFILENRRYKRAGLTTASETAST